MQQKEIDNSAGGEEKVLGCRVLRFEGSRVLRF
jgi:hypothetical protein